MSDLEIPDEVQVMEMVQSLADWVSKQPHLPHIQDDKKLLRKFLINCKYRVQKAKTKIDQYYSARTTQPAVYKNRDPSAEHIRTIARLCPFVPLPKRTSRGELVLYARADPDAGPLIPMDYLRYVTMALDVIFLESDAKLSYIVIIDYQGFSLQHFLKMATIVGSLSDLMLNAYPGQFKGQHCVNAPYYIDNVVALFKQVNKKYRDRIHVHTEVDTLYAMVGRDFLPCDLGGNEKSIEEFNDLYREKSSLTGIG